MSLKSKLKSGVRSIINMTKEEKLYPVPQPVNVQQLLEGKVALISGGTSGIGYAIAEAFVAHGASVAICGTNKIKLKKAVEKMGGDTKVYGFLLDVKDVKAIGESVIRVVEKLGKIDILVNSAGIVVKSSFKDMSEEEYDNIMNINAKGTFFMSQAVSQYMIEKEIKGHILNITSSSALRPAWTPYQMSKWAIRGFTVGLADMLLPYGIIVNAIAPGPVATTMLNKTEGDTISNPEQPSGRYGMPSEIAFMAVMMVSDMCNLVVGDTLYMTGGSGIIDLKH